MVFSIIMYRDGFKGLPAGLTRKGPLRGKIGQRYCGPFIYGSRGTGPRWYWAKAGCKQTLRPATLFSPRTEINSDRVMTMAILALCVSSLSIDNHKLLYTTHLFCMRSKTRLLLLFSFRFFISFRLFTSSSSINDHRASSSSPLHSRASTTMCRGI